MTPKQAVMIKVSELSLAGFQVMITEPRWWWQDAEVQVFAGDRFAGFCGSYGEIARDLRSFCIGVSLAQKL